jgi:hypothetical protein
MSNTFNFGSGKWAAKEGSVLAYNSENNNFKPLPFTFTRASTATRVNESGIIESVASGVPRIDFLDNTDGHLLLEPSRTNLITYSEDFSQWINIGSVTNNANTVVSPDGSQNASNIEFGAIGTSKTFYRTASVALGQVTSSIYLKGTGTLRIYMEKSGGGYFNSKEVTLTSDWVRYDFSINATSASTVLFVVNRQSSDTATEVDIWGAQLEAGSYATSYIPTSGAAVTRAAEDQSSNLSLLPLNIGNSYTLFFDVDLNTLENNKVFFSLSNSAGTLSFTIRNNFGGVRLYDNIGAAYPVSGILSDTNKFVLRIDGTSYKIFVSGTSLSGSIATQRNLGYVSNFFGSNTELKVNEFKIYDTALSDSECQSLVS